MFDNDLVKAGWFDFYGTWMLESRDACPSTQADSYHALWSREVWSVRANTEEAAAYLSERLSRMKRAAELFHGHRL